MVYDNTFQAYLCDDSQSNKWRWLVCVGKEYYGFVDLEPFKWITLAAFHPIKRQLYLVLDGCYLEAFSYNTRQEFPFYRKSNKYPQIQLNETPKCLRVGDKTMAIVFTGGRIIWISLNDFEQVSEYLDSNSSVLDVQPYDPIHWYILTSYPSLILWDTEHNAVIRSLPICEMFRPDKIICKDGQIYLSQTSLVPVLANAFSIYSDCECQPDEIKEYTSDDDPSVTIEESAESAVSVE